MEWLVAGTGGLAASPQLLEACYNRACETWPDRAFTLAAVHIPRSMTLRSGRKLSKHLIIAIRRRVAPGAPRKRRYATRRA